MYLGLLWHQTGDLAAPLVAALAGSSVDFSYLWRYSNGSNADKNSSR